MFSRSSALLCLTMTAAAASAQTNQPVMTDKGDVIGKLSDDGSVRMFLGIPYAAPPVGPLRWKPPQPAQPWTSPRLAQSYGSHCVQVNKFEDMQFRDPGESEDCLTLNVWTPRNAAPGARLPVMVWIYGGGFYAGSTSEARQDGESFAHKGVILVSMNYRLNIFGFFAHPALAAESPQHAAGNYGLMDQAAALQWVQRNIAAFGGDPANVTIFGQSAGSSSVSLQMASPLARNTIARAIGESGAAFPRSGSPSLSLATVEARDEKFAREVLGKTSLADLRAMPAADIVKAVEGQPAPAVHFGTVVDGLFLPEPVPAIFAAGKQAHIPLMAGWVRDEGGLPRDPVTLESYRAHAQQTWGANAGAFLKAYPATTDAEAVRSTADTMSDTFIGTSTWEWIEAQARTGGAPVYRYHYEQPSPPSRYHPATGEAYHSSEIEFVFGNLRARPSSPFTEADYKFSDLLQSYWINFAKSGNPNGPGLPQWPAYKEADQWQVMHLVEPTPAAAPDTTRSRYEFLRTNKPVVAPAR